MSAHARSEGDARTLILETMGRYVYAIDGGRVSEVLEVFLPDGTLVPHGVPECTGHDAIAAFLTASRDSRAEGPDVGRLRHHISSVEIKFEDADNARAHSYFLAMSAVGPDHWGIYRDRIRVAGEQWLFEHRAVEIVGATPGGWMASGAGPVKFETHTA